MSNTLSEPTEGSLGHVSDEDRVHTLVDQHLLYAPIQELLVITGEDRVSHHTLDMAYVVLRDWYSSMTTEQLHQRYNSLTGELT